MSHDNVLQDQRDALSSAALSDVILTVPELAGRLRVAPSWVYANADLLGAYRLGKYLRFSWVRVLSRLEQRPAGIDVGVTAQRRSPGLEDSGAYSTHGTTRER